MKLKLLTIILLIISFSIYSQISDQRAKSELMSSPSFYTDIVNYADKDLNKTRVDIFIKVPLNKIQFVKEGETFHGGYIATVSFYDESKSTLLQEAIWSEKVEIKNYDESLSSSNYNLSIKSFSAKAGNYLINITIEDKDSKKQYSIEKLFIVKNIDTRLGISDLVLLSKSENAADKMIPLVTGIISSKSTVLRTYCELYSDTTRDIKLNIKIVEKNGNVISDNKVKRNVVNGSNRVTFLIDSLNLATGAYLLTVSILDESSGARCVAKKDFITRSPGLPNAVKVIEKAIEQMVYIATPSEMDSLRDEKSAEKRVEKFKEFWKKKDPSLATEENEVMNEYFRRVEFANKNFSHYLEGWKTDMGMVLIILGEPSNVERHPFEIDSKPYEVWEYYDLNKKLVFIDNTGFGDYRLLTPLTGDMTRFR